MSDVIWAAAIAGGVSLVGNAATYLVSRRQTAVSIATEESRSKVELTKVESELEKLREQYREAERSNRQGTYHRLFGVINRQDMIGTGAMQATDAEYTALVQEFNFLFGGVLLFGAEPVTEAINAFVAHLNELGRDMSSQSSGTQVERLRAVYPAHRERLMDAEGALIVAMRDDVTSGLLPV